MTRLLRPHHQDSRTRLLDRAIAAVARLQILEGYQEAAELDELRQDLKAWRDTMARTLEPEA